MPRICYVPRDFKPATLDIIRNAAEIIREYRKQGFDLTLRQLFYQFVSRDLIENSQREYKRLGSIVNDARLAGRLDWSSIEDRTRNLKTHASWDSPADALESVSHWYAENPWENQPVYVEAWIEKDALLGVLQSACAEYRIPYFSCRGYVSQSEMWAAPQRMAAHAKAGRKIYVLHLGDHDPSGVDMSRDIAERLNGFSNVELESGSWKPFTIQVVRLALNMEQIRKYRPPPNPAKMTDARSKGYVDEYGHQSWELDALSPTAIRTLINDATSKLIDHDAWAESMEREEQSKEKLSKLIEIARGDK